MDEVDKTLSGLDKIVIMLGTNDCKAIFEKRKKEIPDHSAKLCKHYWFVHFAIRQIFKFNELQKSKNT